MQSLLLPIPKKISVKLLDFQKMKLRDNSLKQLNSLQNY